MLRADRPHWREALQSRLDKEKRASCRGAKDTGGCAGEDIDPKGLNCRVAVDNFRRRSTEGLVKTETAAVK